MAAERGPTMRYLKHSIACLIVAITLSAGLSVDWNQKAWAAEERGPSTTVTITDTSQLTLVTLLSNYTNKRGATYFIFSTQSGTAVVNYINPAGTGREIVSQAIAASSLTVIDFDFRIPKSVLKFTPDAGSGTVEAEGITY